MTPPILHGVHPNHRLFQRIHQAQTKPVTWIHGPPGAGKTTLVASYLSANAINPLWYRLDEGDADPATLFYYLAIAWKGRDGQAKLPLFKPEYGVALPLFSRRFFRILFTHPATSVAVFDDYHEVAAEALLHQCMANGLEEVPAGCRIIVVSRMPPPPQLARLRINGLIDVVEPDALRITLEEAEGLSRQRGADPATIRVQAILTHTQGWTAGLILMLEAGTDTAAPAHAAGTGDILFDYFAGEIFQRMAAHEQRLLCLLALIPSMTSRSAAALTGEADAVELLEDFRRRNYFTTRDSAAEPHYRFHPLFRDFLLETGRRLLAGEDMARLNVTAAKVLEDDGQAEAAVGLLTAAGALDLLADLVKRHASELIEKGRNDTLLAWLKKLPDAMTAQDGWLTYWLGTVHLYRRPGTALPLLRDAFALFQTADDVPGQYLAWVAQSEAVRVEAFGSLERYDPLIADLRALLARHPDMPAGTITLSVAMGMANALSRRGNDREEIAHWQDIARTAAKADPTRGLAIQAGYLFVIGDLQDANYESARNGLAALPDPLNPEHLSYVLATGLVAVAMALLYRQKDGDCAAFVDEAIRRLDEGGYVQWSPLLASLAANDACQRGAVDSCGVWLGRAGALADRVASNRGPHFHSSMAQYQILRGDLTSAAGHARTATDLAMATGWHLHEALARVVATEVLLESSALDEAAAEIDRLDAVLARSICRAFESTARLLRADLHFARDDAGGGRAMLADALAQARRQDDRRICLTVHRLARLLGRACAEGIEIDYARRLIRATGVPPPDPYDPTWPWPLKISTFGRLTIDCDGAPLAFPRKTPKRLITLLKAIISYGGHDVPEAKLIDAVWPDEDGDAAIGSLKVAVHRLRKLLGDVGAVTWKSNRLGLDPARVWLDLWAFEHDLARRGSNESDTAYSKRTRRAASLYRADFLAEDDDLWWTAHRREKCRKEVEALRVLSRES